LPGRYPAAMPHWDVIVVGAGLSGLTAANRLGSEGLNVLVVEKSRSVGGRLATRQIGSALVDHGAQFFTTRSDVFKLAVASWVETGTVSTWCEGFAENDGYPRYRAAGGMSALAKALEHQLPPSVTLVRSAQAGAMIRLGTGYAVTYNASEREPDEAAAVIMSPPIPLSLNLLKAGGVHIERLLGARLRGVRYHRVVALLATLDSSPSLGSKGALQTPDDATFTFVSDNKAKGISKLPAVTFHTAHELSDQLFDLPEREILARLLPEAERLLAPAKIEQTQVKKWRFAGPVNPLAEPCVRLDGDSNRLILCGDAFGGSKVEGAYLSGLSAAQLIAEMAA